MHVRDVRKPSDHARAIGVAQTAFHVELLVLSRLDGIDRLEVLVQRNVLFAGHGASFLPRGRGPSFKMYVTAALPIMRLLANMAKGSIRRFLYDKALRLAAQ